MTTGIDYLQAAKDTLTRALDQDTSREERDALILQAQVEALISIAEEIGRVRHLQARQR